MDADGAAAPNLVAQLLGHFLADRDAGDDGAGPLRARLERAAQCLDADAATVGADAGRHAAAWWVAHHGPLLQSLSTRPARLVQLAVEEFLAGQDAPATRPAYDVRPDEGHCTVHVPDHWPPAWVSGFLMGLVEATSARGDVRVGSSGSWHVAWTPPPGRRPTALSAVVNPQRIPFLTATLVPVLVALAIAAQDGPVDLMMAGLTLTGVALFHLGANALNEYYARRGAHAHVPSALFGGGADLLPNARVGRGQLRALALALYGGGVAIGLFLAATRGLEVLWLGLVGSLVGLLYSTPPVRLAHRGLGELAVAVGFGPLIVLGTYFVQRQTWSLEALLASLPLAFLIAAVLYINQFPDKEGDARVGKRTLIVRLPERTAVIGYVGLLALTYLLILGGVALAGVPGLEPYAFPPWSLLGLLTLPLAAKASLLLARNYRYPYRLVAANASTLLLHATTGLLFGAGYMISLLA